MDAVDRAEAELFRVPPEDFVAERDARVAAAKESGDRDAAARIGKLRRPSRAAWLVNLLVHDRPDEVEGLLGLADTLASAQRTLDGAALREITAQRNKLVGALTRRAAELGRAGGHRVDSGLERDVRGVLEAALADLELAGHVRSGRLVRAERHAGFGPEPDPGAEPRPTPAKQSTADSADTLSTADIASTADTDRAEDRAAARARSALDTAEQAAQRAREEQNRAREAAAGAERHRDEVHDRVTRLADELERARDELAAANRAAHAASSTEREAARAARTADTARDRAAATLEDLGSS